MKLRRIAFAAPILALVLLASACGGGQSVPPEAAAVVNGTDISRAELDTWLARAKKGYEANKTPFPKVGTQAYQSIQQQWLAILVQRVEYEQAAASMGITATEKDIDKAIAELVKTRFGGDQKKFKQALTQQDFTMASLRDLERTTVLATKIFNRVTKNVTVPQQDVLAYYNQNYSAASRDVRHILISKKDSKGQVDYPKSKAEADRIYAQLQAGANFAALAKKYSADPGSAAQGGNYTAVQGHDVPEFDQVAFALKTGEISKPVKTQYGYHIIQALKPEQRTPLSKVEASIKAQLLQQKKTAASNTWYTDLQKRYKNKIHYATGFAPPPSATTTSATATQ